MPKMTISRFNRMITMAIRLIVGIGLGYFLIHLTLKYTGTDLLGEVFDANKPILIFACLFDGALFSLTICRWNLLLRVQGIYLKIWDLIRLTMIGNFFSLALPGAAGGDLLKMAYLTGYTKSKKMEGALTVLLDRLLGVLGLFILAAVMLVLYLPFLIDLDRGYLPIKITAFIVGLASMTSIFGIFLAGKSRALMRYRWMISLVDCGKRKLPASVVLALGRLVDALDLYDQNRSTVIIAVILSVLGHMGVAINLFAIGAAVGENSLQMGDYFLAVTVSNAVAGIPITPGGIGTRDATAAMFFVALGTSAAKAGVVPVIFTLIIVFWGLVGGIFFMISRFPKYETQPWKSSLRIKGDLDNSHGT